MSTHVNLDSDTMEIRRYIVGREGHIYLGNASVSRHHAEIKFEKDRIRLRDLGSTNGIFLISDNKIKRIKNAYVGLNQPIMIGTEKCTVKTLLDNLERTQTIYN